MNWIESIKEIQKAQENNQLVIFVGSGVSKNSSIPTWKELIEKISDKIGYDRCNLCKKAKEDCAKEKCIDKKAFTQDEFLRIPEYLFQNDGSENNIDYYSFIQETLKSDLGSNPIDEEIFKILPHHIITTNYDSLLENSTDVNSQLYTVVSQDKDLLSKSSERYIIKMHGDLNNPETIVLKESDYIDYEQEHPLISTFIRSLLINHTFLFLGYSLNDYNLNLIIGWINYFKKRHKVEQRPHNFLVSSDSPTKFEFSRLEDKNIYIVDLNSLPEDIEKDISIPESLSNPTGRKMFSYLKCITNQKLLQHYVPLGEILSEKYQVLKPYHKISHEDLLNIQNLGRPSFLGTELIFHEKEWFSNIKKLIEGNNHDVIDTFQRAGISAIHFWDDDSRVSVPSLKNTEDGLMLLYLDNRYNELYKQLKTCTDISQKIYYLRLLNEKPEIINKLLDEESEITQGKDFISVMLHKMRKRLVKLSLIDDQPELTKEIEHLFNTAPAKYRNSIIYLKSLFNSQSKNIQEMEKILGKLEKRYEYNSNTWHSGHAHFHIWEIQAYAYDYYFFIKENSLPFDSFSDPKNYLSYYLRALLCSCSPVKAQPTYDYFGFPTHKEPYPLADIEIDMFTKYCDSKSLLSWIRKYSVQKILIEDGVDVVSKYLNYLSGFPKFQSFFSFDQIYCFTIIICLIELDNTSKKKMLKSMVSLCENLAKSDSIIITHIFDTIYYMISHLIIEDANEEKEKLISVLVSKNIYPKIIERNRGKFSRVVNILSPFANENTKQNLINEINSIENVKEKSNIINLFYKLIPQKLYADFLSENISNLSASLVFELLTNKVISYSNAIEDVFINTIESEVDKRQKSPNMRTNPDWLKTSIEEFLILKLIGFNVDLCKLKPYIEYSDFLDFALNPQTFDYSKVDFTHYMWQNFVYSKQYKSFFKEHKKDLITETLKNCFDMGLETTEQQRIVYGLLLDEQELRDF